MTAQTEKQLLHKTIIALVDENTKQQEQLDELSEAIDHCRELLSVVGYEVLLLKKKDNITD